MKVMIKFELDVLNEMNYALLTKLADNLTNSLETSKKLKKEYTTSGEIIRAASIEASIIRMEENYDLVKLAMVSKEGDVLESFKFGMEPFSLN